MPKTATDALQTAKPLREQDFTSRVAQLRRGHFSVAKQPFAGFEGRPKQYSHRLLAFIRFTG